MTKGSTSDRRINAAENTFDIINCIMEQDEATLGNIANEVDLTKSTVHTYLATMMNRGFVRSHGNTYSLSLRFLEVGETVRGQIEGITILRDVLSDVVNQTDGIAWFIVEEDGHAVFVEKATGEDAVQPYGYIGRRTTLHDIAGGKAILAHLSEERLEETIAGRGLPAKTDRTITDRDELRRELERIREQGFAVNRGENLQGWRAVASPIIHEGTVFGSIAASGPKHRMHDDRLTETIPDIVTAATNEVQLRFLSE